MFDFPNAPSNGQQVTAPTGVVYVWDGTKWAPVGVGLPAYAPLASPVFTGDARAVTPAYADNDTSIATSQFVQSAVAPVANNVGRNLIHNSLFNVQQRGLGAFTTNAAMTADRWQIVFQGGSSTVALGALLDGSRAQIGDEAAANYLNNNFVGTAGAGDYNFLQQNIEGVRRLSGKTVTLSFYAVAASGTPKLGAGLAQVFGTGGSPSAAVTINGQSITLSTVFQRYSMTFALPSTSGMTLGTNNNDCTAMRLWFSAGANSAAASGNVGVQSASISLWGVQLEIGAQATLLEKPDPQQDLARCQRFYQQGVFDISLGYGSGGWTNQIPQIFCVVMRAAPTLAITGTPTYTNASGAQLIPMGNIGFKLGWNAVAAGGTAVSGANWTASADL